MAEHEPGKMDIKEQERTFEGFIRWGSIGFVVVAIALIFMALVNS
ncbi:MAG: aa3-type cytochrome c oxidase subunit IV [Pseudomonadota bacterium]